MGLRQDKYAEDSGLLYRFTMYHFFTALHQLLAQITVNSVFDAGCGEGDIMRRMLTEYGCTELIGSDIDYKRLQFARGQADQRLFQADLEALPLQNNEVDLVLCLEVLEHVGNPEAALGELCRVTNRYAILSVPNEPFWRIANMARGAYWSEWGNTPEHINHWSVWGFKRFVGAHFKVLAVRTPITWTMLLLEKIPQ